MIWDKLNSLLKEFDNLTFNPLYNNILKQTSKKFNEFVDSEPMGEQDDPYDFFKEELENQKEFCEDMDLNNKMVKEIIDDNFYPLIATLSKLKNLEYHQLWETYLLV